MTANASAGVALETSGDGRCSGRADDVVGTADGTARGNAFRWQYTLRLPVDGKNTRCSSMTGCTSSTTVMLNHATMSKLGSNSAKCSFRSTGRGETCAPARGVGAHHANRRRAGVQVEVRMKRCTVAAVVA